MTQRIVNIDKVIAAGCQIDTAIEVIFGTFDVVSPVVLTYSAWSIIKDLMKKKSIEDGARSWMLELYPNKDSKEIFRKLDEAWCFFKHAKDDHLKVLQMPEDFSEPSLFLAIHGFSLLSSNRSQFMDIYELWFVAKHKDFFDTDEHKDLFLNASNLFPDLHLKDLIEQRKLGLDIIRKI